MSAIQTVEEFLDAFKVGDRFWNTTSLHGRPYEVIGPLEITSLFKDPKDQWRIVFTDHGSGYVSSDTIPHYVADIANGLHAAFRNRATAFVYFREEYARHITDPELVREYKRNKFVGKTRQEMLEKHFDEELSDTLGTF